ncbi:SsgA family sporulation/cell division regulator [Streptomyces sp. 549]|uniref:SsgA family sporulation/cell division regulator n=1 Tax=Streptomyces sp. 549 TaxID=3049076 RepID=UPI0024C25227|nr:SsgA family sporulation/cell division regulator [Streptomyces sp. 549]MDK1476029.1 SsgA family sporulation/cell division regulator [Streptomyces sp. 549]
MSTAIDLTVQARVVARPAAFPIFATLHYDSRDPLAVQVVFPAEVALDGVEVAWTFARSLLDEAQRGPVGHGDVRLWPHGPDRTMLELQATEGLALVEIPSREVRTFLAESYRLVSEADEHRRLDVEQSLALLLRGV